jgi:hypothetical protein
LDTNLQTESKLFAELLMLVPGQLLSKEVGQVFLCLDVFDLDRPLVHLLLGVVVLYVDVLRPFVGGVVFCESNSSLVVLPNGGHLFLVVAEVLEQRTKAHRLSRSLVEGVVFSHGRRRGDRGLVFGTPSDQVGSLKEAEPSNYT